MKKARKTAFEALLSREGIVRPAADLKLPVGFGCIDAAPAAKEANMFGNDLADRVDGIQKTMNEAGVSSSVHPEDVLMTVVNGVLATAELHQGLPNSAFYAHEITVVRTAPDHANLPIESLNGSIHPAELWLAGRIPTVNRQAYRLGQAQGYQEA